MSRILKTWNNMIKRKSQTMEEDGLVSNIVEPADGFPRQQTCCSMNTTDRFGTDPKMYTQDCEHNEETILSILKDTLMGDMRSQELKDAAEQVKQWAKLNGVTPDGNKGFSSHSQRWLKEYLVAVEMFVDKHFPVLQTESQPHIGEYLNEATSLMCSKVIGLVPVLEDLGLLSYLLDSYNRCLFAMLDLLMDRSSSVKDALFLLQWVKQTYFRQDFKGCSITQNGVLSVSDPLLLTEWFEKSKQKYLALIQDYISTTLQNILLDDEAHCVWDDSNEEGFIKVQLDVIQCLNACLTSLNTVSQTLKNAVQRLCCDELHCFIQKYVNAQMAKETNLLHIFRTIYTCRQLRSYALRIMDLNNNTDSLTLLMLENAEAQALSNANQLFASKAKEYLKKYFNKEDAHIYKLIDMLQKILATLPHMEQGEKTKQDIIKEAYQSVTRAYLQCLIHRKYKELERSWDDVEKRIMHDAELFHIIFAQQNGGGDEQKMVLLKMGEILRWRDVDSLKLICSELYSNFPKESEEYVSVLLHWRGGLSRGQIRKILDVSQEVCHNGGHVRPHALMYCCCCLGT